MSQSHNTFRVFISSTFSDMVAEREALQKLVFPRLQELCQRYQAEFQAIDLRWGISQEASLDHRTLDICLNEIRQCQRITPRPNFIFLLGDRYGWIPLPNRIEQSEFESLMPFVSDEGGPTSDRALLCWSDNHSIEQPGFYRLDENAVPGEYVLQPRQTNLSSEVEQRQEEQIWAIHEQRLRRIFHSAIEQAGWGLDDPRRLKYEASATEQEIVQGVFSQPDLTRHVFGYFRSIFTSQKKPIWQDLPQDSAIHQYLDITTENGLYNLDRQAQNRLHTLKEARLRPLLGTNIHDYETAWMGAGIGLEHSGVSQSTQTTNCLTAQSSVDGCLQLLNDPLRAHDLCTDVWCDLATIILQQLLEMQAQDDLSQEIETHSRFAEMRGQDFSGREIPLQTISDYLRSEATQPLLIWGESGAGKSALIAHAITQQVRTGTFVLFRFIGATPRSTRVHSLLETLCQQIRRLYGVSEKLLPVDFKELVAEFHKILELATTQQPLTIFLDGLDQLSDTQALKDINWIPWRLPPSVHLVFSCTRETVEIFRPKMTEQNLLYLSPLNKEESLDLLVTWLRKNKRTLQTNQINMVLEKFHQCSLPLFVKLVFEETRLWKSYDPVPDFKSDISSLLRYMLARLSLESRHGNLFVSRALGYLASAKNGLSETELLEVLSLDDEVLHDFQRRSPKSPIVHQLPVIVWAQLYFDLEPYLVKHQIDGVPLISFYHRQVAEVCQSDYRNPLLNAALAEYFKYQPLYLNDETQIPNQRKLSEMLFQQIHAGMHDQVETTLLDYYYLEAKLNGQGLQELSSDFELAQQSGLQLQKNNAIAYVAKTITLSAHILSQDAEQLAGQLIGRLFSIEDKEIQTFIQSLPSLVRKTWWRPTLPCLTAPDSPMERVFAGHRGFINSLVLSHDKNLAFSGDSSKYIKVWDLASGECKQTLTIPSPMNHDYSVNTLILLDDEKTLVSSSTPAGKWESEIRLWNWEDAICLKTFGWSTGKIDEFVCSPDGIKMFFTTKPEKVSFSGEPIFQLDLYSGNWQVFHPDSHRIAVMKISADGKTIFTGSFEGKLSMWDVENRSCIMSLDAHTKGISALALSNDGSILVSGARDHCIKIWEVSTGLCLRTIDGLKSYPQFLDISPDGKFIASNVGNQFAFTIWDVKDGEIRHVFAGYSGIKKVVRFTQSGSGLLAGEGDKLYLWNLRQNDVEASQGRLRIEGNPVVPILMPDGKFLITAPRHIKIWDPRTEQFVQEFYSDLPIYQQCLSADGSKLLVASFKMVQLLDTHTGMKLLDFPPMRRDVTCLALSPDGLWAAAGSRDWAIYIWDLRNGEISQILRNHREEIRQIAFTRQGNLISVAADADLMVWDIANGNPTLIIEGRHFLSRSFCLSPDERQIIAHSPPGNLKYWDLMDGNCSRVLNLNIHPLFISPDGKVFSKDSHTIHVWDINTAQKIASFSGDTDFVAVAYDSKGKLLVLSDSGGTLYFLKLEEPINQV